MADSTVYTLHYFPFSLYSLMARFGFVLGQTLNPETAPALEIKLVNLHREENLTEAYLTQINPRGQVPALTSSALSIPITDSHEIATWLCGKQPELLPEEHRETIERILSKLYAFHAQALVVSPDVMRDGIPNQAAAILENPDISETHRRALEIKSVFHDTLHCRTVEPSHIQEVEDQTRDLTRDLAEVLSQHNDGRTWIFGDTPTILDAYVTALAARLFDIQRFDLLSDTVRVYAEGVIKTEEWHKVTHGRPTNWDRSMGHVAELDPL